MRHLRTYNTVLWLCAGLFLVLLALPALSQAEIQQVRMGVDGMV